ncbi:MAG: universal stress protein [Caulobacterales bacterium]
MTYATILAHLAPGRQNTRLLNVVGRLADRFNAGIVGIAACQPMMVSYGEGFTSSDLVQADRDDIVKNLQDAENEFRATFQSRATPYEWRSTISAAPLADYVVAEARCADLIVVGLIAEDLFARSRAAQIGDLILQAGRPVLLVPEAVDALSVNRVVLAWKDTREARRAAADALPILAAASHVALVEIAAEADFSLARVRLGDVASWLTAHGVSAAAKVVRATGDDAGQLASVCKEEGADVLVAGAYGHSRMREWAFGGVTRDLLLTSGRCVLVSH